MDLKGRLLGNRYEIIEKIGSGGMATVYKAKCHVLNRYVAIKILRDEFTTDEEFIKRFEVEAQSAASITHPNIVSVYDVGVDGNLYYIVMELIKGKTLKEIVIEEKGPLPWKWSVNIAIQIASALEIAHKNHIIHRDIKPHNIIITEDGVAKVTDFGIAKAVSNSTITAFGTTIGSVHYFSPEHARGGFTDEKSDLYSLGVVMYEMLTGKVPFDADTPVSVALKHMQEEAIPALSVNPNIPKAVNDIIMKALKKDVSLRYQSATEMLIDLRRSLKDPDGRFVDNNEYTGEFPTQRITTLGGEEERGPKATEKKGKKEKKQNGFVKFIKKHKIISSIVGLIILFMITVGITILIANITNPKEVAIPNLVGKTVEEAQQILSENKLVYVEESQEYSTEYEAGQIISQDPQYVENRNIKQNTEVKVVVSLGAETTTVPKLKGLTQEEAETEAQNANIELNIVEQTSKTVEEGIVISQDIEEGETINAGETVTIYVSSGTGIKQVTVVSVIGQDESTAKTTLENLGLVVTVSYAESTSNNGKVTAQSIDANKVVDEGSSITLTVNKVTETKDLTVNIDIEKITGGYDTETTDNTTNTTGTTSSRYVTVKVNDETRTNVDKNNSNYSVTISGKDGESGTVKVTITDSSTGEELYSSTKTVTYGSQDSVSFN